MNSHTPLRKASPSPTARDRSSPPKKHRAMQRTPISASTSPMRTPTPRSPTHGGSTQKKKRSSTTTPKRQPSSARSPHKRRSPRGQPSTSTRMATPPASRVSPPSPRGPRSSAHPAGRSTSPEPTSHPQHRPSPSRCVGSTSARGSVQPRSDSVAPRRSTVRASITSARAPSAAAPPTVPTNAREAERFIERFQHEQQASKKEHRRALETRGIGPTQKKTGRPTSTTPATSTIGATRSPRRVASAPVGRTTTTTKNKTVASAPPPTPSQRVTRPRRIIPTTTTTTTRPASTPSRSNNTIPTGLVHPYGRVAASRTSSISTTPKSTPRANSPSPSSTMTAARTPRTTSSIAASSPRPRLSSPSTAGAAVSAKNARVPFSRTTISNFMRPPTTSSAVSHLVRADTRDSLRGRGSLKAPSVLSQESSRRSSKSPSKGGKKKKHTTGSSEPEEPRMHGPLPISTTALEKPPLGCLPINRPLQEPPVQVPMERTETALPNSSQSREFRASPPPCYASLSPHRDDAENYFRGESPPHGLSPLAMFPPRLSGCADSDSGTAPYERTSASKSPWFCGTRCQSLDNDEVAVGPGVVRDLFVRQ